MTRWSVGVPFGPWYSILVVNTGIVLLNILSNLAFRSARRKELRLDRPGNQQWRIPIDNNDCIWTSGLKIGVVISPYTPYWVLVWCFAWGYIKAPMNIDRTSCISLNPGRSNDNEDCQAWTPEYCMIKVVKTTTRTRREYSSISPPWQVEQVWWGVWTLSSPQGSSSSFSSSNTFLFLASFLFFLLTLDSCWAGAGSTGQTA